MAGILPSQKKSKVEKEENDFAWYKENIDYYIDQSGFYSGDRWEIIELYRTAMGIIDKSLYKYVLNPYATEDANLLNYPSQLRNYDIITPIISLFVGEKAEKPNNIQVICSNPNSINEMKENLDKAFMGVLAQTFVNKLNEQGVPTGVETKEVPPLEKVAEQYKTNYNDKRAEFGQEAIDYLKFNLNLKDKYQEAFYDWLVTAKVYTYKDVANNDVLHQIVPPLEFWHGTSQTGFVEDANWTLRKTRYNLNDCIDKFKEVLTEKEIKELEQKFVNGNEVTTQQFYTTPNLDKTTSSSSNADNVIFPNGLIDVYHVTWKSFRKTGILSYIDEFGMEQQLEVDETYKLDKKHGDIEIEWVWDNQVMEGYRIGESLYKYLRPILVQRDGKLPYNGRTGYSERNRKASIVKMLTPYQVLYNIVHYRRELTLARNKDKLLLMPKGLMPAGWAEEKFLYFAEATGIAFFDETKPNAANVLNAIKSIDLGLGTYIEQSNALLRDIKAEAWENIGMNRQRYGMTNSSDGKGVNEQAIANSATISREIFRRFERFQESDEQGLLDYSKTAWINGKKGMYINSAGRKAFLDVNPEQHLESDYQIFCVDSIEEAQKLNQAKQYAFGWAQKGTSPASTVLEVLDANNMASLKNLVSKLETTEKEYQQAMEEKKMQNDQALADKETARNRENNQTKKDVATIMVEGQKYGHDVKSATDIKTTEMSNDGQDTPAVEQVDSAYNNYLMQLHDRDLEKQKLGLTAMKQASDARLKEIDLQLKDKKINNDLKIAIKNKNKYDK